MSANVATNFPPQTYSSSFFLNVLNEDVGSASSSKKQPNSSNNILDCFISTMIKANFILILLYLINQTPKCAGLKKYECMDAAHPSTRTYNSIIQFQQNRVPFAPQENHITFNTTTISQLNTNDFIAYDSNHIRKIILTDKRIELINTGAFNQLYCLRFLILQNNMISQIVNGSFIGLYSLETLDLSYNLIQTIGSGGFWNLKRLLKLNLSHNKLENLYPNSLEYLSSLYELNLEFNQIFDLPDKFFYPTTHLHQLFLGNNQISTPTKQEFDNLNNLDVLDLKNNQINGFGPNTLNQLNKLTELNLSYNKLTKLNCSELPRESLQKIYLDHNLFICQTLKELLIDLEQLEINIVINNDEIQSKNINFTQIGCVDNSSKYFSPISTTTHINFFTNEIKSSTTTKIPKKLDDLTDFIDNNNKEIDKSEKTESNVILKAINDLKTVVIILIIIIVMFNVIHIMIKTDTCAKLKRSPPNILPLQSCSYSETDFPLLAR